MAPFGSPEGSSKPSREELRLRQLRSALETRAAVTRFLRRFFEARGSLEVETPSRVRCPGTDVHLDPLASGDRFLITSPELHMKRLVAAGYGRVHQLCRCYRAGELGELHNPEFTMLEWYWPGATYLDLAAELEELVQALASEVTGGAPRLPGRAVDLSAPWERLTVRQAFRDLAGWEPDGAPAEQRFFLDLVEKVEPRLGRARPTFLIEYPASQAALARRKPTDPTVALRFELYIDGVELANAFDELTDPEEQRRRFGSDNHARALAGKPVMPIDEEFLAALEQLPPTAGCALGLDRLVMLLVGASGLAEVLAFPERQDDPR